jgi:2-hydroxy-6-oxonona-2,4-dienedioate hydrolase
MSPRISHRGRTALTVAAVVSLAGFLPTYVTDRRAIGPAYDRIATGSQIAETRCGPIEYAATGEGLPVLVVHGAGGGFDQGLELAAAFARDGFRIIAVSRFGYLRTPLPADASAAAQADAHVCLLDALNIPRAVVVGVSAGGPSTLQFALRHPDRTAAMVLLVPGVYAPGTNHVGPARMSRATAFLIDSTLRSDFIFWAGTKLAHDAFIRSVLGTPPEVVARAPAGEQARLDEVLAEILPVRPRRLGLLNDATVVSSQRRTELETITAPTLVISAADDLYGTFEPARYTAAHVPHARFIGYPSGGHMLVGRSAEVAAEVAAFVSRSARF